MKIDPINNQGIFKNYQAVGKVAPKSDVDAPRDAVTVSDEAQSFAKVLAEAKEAIDVRTLEEKARIDEITLAVRQGTYKVDSDKIAEKILESIFRK